MGTHKIKREKQGYVMTSVNLRREEREILQRIMKRDGLRMGEAIRAAIQRLGESTHVE